MQAGSMSHVPLYSQSQCWLKAGAGKCNRYWGLKDSWEARGCSRERMNVEEDVGKMPDVKGKGQSDCILIRHRWQHWRTDMVEYLEHPKVSVVYPDFRSESCDY